MEVPAIRLLLLLLFWVWAPAPSSASPEVPPLVNEDVKRTVDLSSHLAKVTAEVVLAHPGGGSTSRASSFLLALEPELEARLAYLGVQVSSGASAAPCSCTVSPGVGAAAPPPWTRQHKPGLARSAPVCRASTSRAASVASRW